MSGKRGRTVEHGSAKPLEFLAVVARHNTSLMIAAIFLAAEHRKFFALLGAGVLVLLAVLFAILEFCFSTTINPLFSRERPKKGNRENP